MTYNSSKNHLFKDKNIKTNKNEIKIKVKKSNQSGTLVRHVSTKIFVSHHHLCGANNNIINKIFVK